MLPRYASAFALLDESGFLVSEQGKPAAVHDAVAYEDAFGREHADDAHFTCYGLRDRVSGVLEKSFPRIAKSALSLLNSELVPPDLARMEVYGHCLALDYDLPEHGGWTAPLRASVGKAFDLLRNAGSILASPSVFYTTSGGLRLVWFLSNAVPMEGKRGLEDLLGGLVATAHIQELEVDPACRDWTRLFRLPRVRREDKSAVERQSSAQEYFRQSWGRVDFSATEQAPAAARLFPVESFKGLSELTHADFKVSGAGRRLADKWGPKIGVEPQRHSGMASLINVGSPYTDAEGQKYKTSANGFGISVAYDRIKMKLQTQANPRGVRAKPWPSAQYAYGVVFDDQELFPGAAAGEQGLHEGIGKLARALCYCLRDDLHDDADNVPPQAIDVMVFAAAFRANKARANGQRSSEQLHAEVWRMVAHTYRQYRFQRAELERQKTESAADEAHRIENEFLITGVRGERIREQMRAWTQRDAAPGSILTDAQNEWIKKNYGHLLMISTEQWGTSVIQFSLTGEISYSDPVKKLGGVYAAIRDARHSMIDLYRPSSKEDQMGERKTEAMLMAECGTTAPAVRCSRLITRNELELVQLNDTLVPTFKRALPGMRTDISPRYDSRVEAWLYSLGGSLAEKLMDWLACYTRIDQPICGLYIQGEPGIGKGMLAQALKNMTARKESGNLDSMLDQFQDIAFQTPFIWGDEDVSTPSRTQRSVMNCYKKIVSGEFDKLNPKGTAQTKVEGFWRTLITANTDKFLKMDEDVNDDDLNAIVVRTLHIHADSIGCKALLRKIGGHGTKSGEGTFDWPTSNIPCHIAWLAAERKVVPGDRFLVEGVKTDFHDGLSMNTGIGEAVLKFIGKIMKNPSGAEAKGVMTYDMGEEHLYVMSGELKAKLTAASAQDRFSPRITPSGVKSALMNLTEGKDRKCSYKPVGQAGVGQTPRKVYKISVKTLMARLHLAEEDVNYQSVLGETLWRALAPHDVVEEYDKINKRAISAPVPPVLPPTLPVQSILNALKPSTKQ